MQAQAMNRDLALKVINSGNLVRIDSTMTIEEMIEFIVERAELIGRAKGFLEGSASRRSNSK